MNLEKMPLVPDWLAKLAGASAFSAYLRSLGRDALVVRLNQSSPDPDAPPPSNRDRHLVMLAKSPIHLVSLRLGEGCADRRGFPIAHHYVVPVGNVRADDDYDARLGQSFGGLFQRRRTRLTFVGGALSDVLRADDQVRSALFDYLAPNDDLMVAADVARGLVRIVHVHRMSRRKPLWVPHSSTYFEQFLPEPLIGAFERIATHVRALPRLRPDRLQSKSA